MAEASGIRRKPKTSVIAKRQVYLRKRRVSPKTGVRWHSLPHNSIVRESPDDNIKTQSESLWVLTGGDEGIRRKPKASVIAERQVYLRKRRVSPKTGVRWHSLPHNSIVRESPDDNIKTQSESLWVLTGGDEGIRTPDLCVANASLYQLSHAPTGYGLSVP